jgi:hypothetical protein
MTAVLTDAETRAHGGDAIALRDAALVELLYASALRVSELCGTDVDDIDRERRTVRVVGKGSKERVVPYGAPAAHALDAYLARGRSVLVGRGSGTAALFVGARGARLGARSAYDVVSRVVSPAVGQSVGPTRCATPQPRICSTAAPTCARCRRCSVMPVSERPRSTHMSRRSDWRPRTGGRILARECVAGLLS